MKEASGEKEESGEKEASEVEKEEQVEKLKVEHEHGREQDQQQGHELGKKDEEMKRTTQQINN